MMKIIKNFLCGFAATIIGAGFLFLIVGPLAHFITTNDPEWFWIYIPVGMPLIYLLGKQIRES